MAYGCFADRADRPDLGRAEQVLGAARPLWDALLDELRRHTSAAPAWRFYGRNYGWALSDAAVSEATHALMSSLPRFDGGCWVFVPVTDEDDVADARRLILIRAGVARGGGRHGSDRPWDD